MEYYENELGQIAVLVSCGFGAGWSTWNTEELAYDKRVVEFWLSKKDDKAFMRAIDSFKENEAIRDTKKIFESFGYTGVYFGGFGDIELVWVDKGMPFRIDEYDGAESIEYYADAGFITFD